MKKILLIIPALLFLVFSAYVLADEPGDYDCYETPDLILCVNNVTGSQTLEVVPLRFDNGTGYETINTTIVPSTFETYDYEVTKADYDVYFAESPGQGDTVKFVRNGTEITFQPHALQFNNDLSQLQQISMPTDNGFIVNGSDFYYNSTYGDGLHLKYKMLKEAIKEELIIPTRESIGTPDQYVIDGGNVTVDLAFVLTSNAQKIVIEGIEWDRESTVETFGSIDIKDNDNNTIFTLVEPKMYDSADRELGGSYVLKKSANKLYVTMKFDYEFLNDTNTTYPVYLDPSLNLTSGTTTLGGLQTYDWVYVAGGAILYIDSGIDYLNLTASQYITIEGTINGDSRGGAGGGGCADSCSGSSGTGPGASGGQGAYVGAGGAGHVNSGGSGGAGGGGGGSYGSSSDFTAYIGSGAGGGGSNGPVNQGGSGGSGGAWLELSAPTVTVSGTIDMDGGNGAGAHGGNGYASAGGGGSGGTIIMKAIWLSVNNSAMGARAGSGGTCSDNDIVCQGGGGGSGGRIKLFYEETYGSSGLSYNVAGGGGGSGINGGASGSSSSAGTFYTLQVDDLGLNQVPTLDSNSTIPSPVLVGQDMYINITTSDSNFDNITGAYFTIALPNSTVLLDDVNGTWISGNSADGEAEEWHSDNISILNSTDYLGTYDWNLTIVSDGSNPNATYSGTFDVADSSNPVVVINAPVENQSFATNVSIDFNITVSDDVEIDSCWYSLDSGSTNNTMNCSFEEFNIIAGTYNITFYANDTSNNVGSSVVQNISIIADVIAPDITIVSPTTTIYDDIFNVDVTVTDAGGYDYCFFNITGVLGTPTYVANTAIPDCDAQATTLSSDGTYLVNIWANDTSGNSNQVNRTFVLDTSGNTTGGTSGGGGGGVTVVSESGDIKWTMATSSGGTKYQFNMVKDSVRTGSIVFTNEGAESLTLEMTCKSVTGPTNLCQYLSFDEKQVTLPLVAEQKTINGFTISIPEDIPKGDYIINIIATDNKGNVGIISTEVNVETFNFLVGFATKLITSKDMFGVAIPNILVFLLITIVVWALSNYLILRPSKVAGAGGIAVIIGLVAGTISVIII